MAVGSTCSALVRVSLHNIFLEHNSTSDPPLRYNGEDQSLPSAQRITGSAKSIPAQRSTPVTPPVPTNNNVDEIDDDTLIDQYDVSGRIGHQIFGALDTRGLEDVGEDEPDEGLDLEDESKYLFFQHPHMTILIIIHVISARYI